MKHPYIFRSLLLLLLLSLASIGHAKLRVVTTTTDLAAIAQAVGGDEVEITALAAATQDPHYVDARPNLLVPLSRARVLIINGLELEVGWLPALLANARNRNIIEGASGYIDASRWVDVQGIPAAGTDRASGDVHPSGNPHFSYDPRQTARVAIGLRDRFIQIAPEKRDTWTQNTQRFLTELDALTREQRERFAELPAAKRQVVSYHSSLVYLFQWLQLRELTTVEPLPGIDPTPRHTASVLQQMRAQNVRVIVQEEFYPRSTSKTLASMVDGEVVVLPGSTRFGSQSYLDHLREVADALYRAVSQP